MAVSPPELVTFLMDELSEQNEITTRRFFGGWQLRSEDRQFAIIMNGTLFFRVEGALFEEMQHQGCRPFCYTKQGKQVSVPKYMSAPDGVLDELDQLKAWVGRVIAAT